MTVREKEEGKCVISEDSRDSHDLHALDSAKKKEKAGLRAGLLRNGFGISGSRRRFFVGFEEAL